MTWIGAYLDVHVPQLGHVCADDLVGVHEDDLAQRQREQHVQEQDLVRPDDALLLGLQHQMSAICQTLCELLYLQQYCQTSVMICGQDMILMSH